MYLPKTSKVTNESCGILSLKLSAGLVGSGWYGRIGPRGRVAGLVGPFVDVQVDFCKRALDADQLGSG